MKNSNLTIFENLKRKVDNNPMSQGIATQFINLLDEIDKNKGWNETLNEKASLLLASSKTNLNEA